MPADVHALVTGRDEIKASVVRTLRDALEQAETGEIVAVAIAVVRPNGSINTSTSDADPVAPLLGAVDVLHARILGELLTG